METYYDRVKNIFEVERFSGRNVRSIEQDFFGLIFLTTLESVLSKQAEAKLAQESVTAQRKHVAQVNHAVSYLALVDPTVALLLDPLGTVEETLATLHFLFKTNPTLHHPDDDFHGNGGLVIGEHGSIATSSAPLLNLMALNRRRVQPLLGRSVFKKSLVEGRQPAQGGGPQGYLATRCTCRYDGQLPTTP